MNCFYCSQPIVNGHCANHCAEKKQVEQGHIDQEYQRKLIQQVPEKGVRGLVIIALCEAGFIAALIVFAVRGCSHAPAIGGTFL